MNRRGLLKSLAGIVASAAGIRFVPPRSTIGITILEEFTAIGPASEFTFPGYFDPDCVTHNLITGLMHEPLGSNPDLLVHIEK